MYRELSRPVPWDIKEPWYKGKPVFSSDIASLINFMITKSTWQKDDTFQIVLLPLNVSSDVTQNQIQANLTELVIHYEDKFPSKLLAYFISIIFFQSYIISHHRSNRITDVGVKHI